MDHAMIEQLRQDTRGLRVGLATSNATIAGLRRTETALESDIESTWVLASLVQRMSDRIGLQCQREPNLEGS